MFRAHMGPDNNYYLPPNNHQPRATKLQQSATQQPFLLQGCQEQAQAQAQPLRPEELHQPKIHVNSFSQQIDEEIPKKGGSDLPSYDSL